MSLQSGSLLVRSLGTGGSGSRMTRDEYGMAFARTASLRAACTRSRVGAAIFGADHRIVMTGHNGAPAGHPHCLDGACPRGRHYAMTLEEELARQGVTPDTYSGDISFSRPITCGCGNPWPCPDAVDPMTPYDTGPGLCIGIHAEANAIIHADHHRLPGSVIYITREPCHNCTLLIQAAGIKEAVVP